METCKKLIWINGDYYHSQIIYITISFKAVQELSTIASNHNHTLLSPALFHNQIPIHDSLQNRDSDISSIISYWVYMKNTD